MLAEVVVRTSSRRRVRRRPRDDEERDYESGSRSTDATEYSVPVSWYAMTNVGRVDYFSALIAAS